MLAVLRRAARFPATPPRPPLPAPRPLATAPPPSAESPSPTQSPELAPLQDALGRPHDYLRISLTERCNLRCQYCMPAGGVPLSPRDALLTSEEVVRLAHVFAALGVRKVRLTGGEPTLRRDLTTLVAALAAVPGLEKLAITTNAVAVARRLPELQRAGLTAINVSLDSLRPDRYERMARRPGLPRVLAAIDLALQLGFSPVKVNTVLMKGFNDDEICDFVELTRDRDLEVRQRVERGDAGAVPRGAARAGRAVPGAARAAPRAAPHCAGVAGAGVRGPRGLRGVHDAAVLQRVQPAAANGGWQPQGLLVWRGRGVPARRGAWGRQRRRAGRTRAQGSPQQEAPARGYGESRQNEKSSNDTYRGVVVQRLCSGGHRQFSTLGLLEGRRGYCTLSHVDGEGRARMVDVSHKAESVRVAVAECHVTLGAHALELLRTHALRKGDALCVAEVAGVLAAKRTADLIPLCHPLPLASARVHVALPEPGRAGPVAVRCEVRVTARTGAEMEALTGCAVAALTLYDMCKSADPGIVIGDLRLLHKSGGSRGRAPGDPPQPAT